MGRLDFDKLAAEANKNHEQFMKERAAFYKRCNDHRDLLDRAGLGFGVIPSGRANIDYVLFGNTPRDGCVFDESRLVEVSSASFVEGDKLLFQCEKCKYKYILPPNAERLKQIQAERRTIVYAGAVTI